LATEAAGSWVLATIDVDANPRSRSAEGTEQFHGVRVLGGRLVPGFQGGCTTARSAVRGRGVAGGKDAA